MELWLHTSCMQRFSRHTARKIAAQITELTPVKVDICPFSCITYTGEFGDMTSCPHIRNKRICGALHCQPVSEGSNQSMSYSCAKMMMLPVMAPIQAMYSNKTFSEMMWHRDKLLQQTLHLVAFAAGQEKQTYSDFGNSDDHLFHHNELGLFQDSCDVALALSTDGAQLTMKKLSDTCLVIIWQCDLCLCDTRS